MSSATQQPERSHGEITEVMADDPIRVPSNSDRWAPLATARPTTWESCSPERTTVRRDSEHDHLQDAIRRLKSDSAAERVAAAQALGNSGSFFPTAYLIAALFDQAPEVRRAAAGALNQIRDPDVALDWVNALIADKGSQAPNRIDPATKREFQTKSLGAEGGVQNQIDGQFRGSKDDQRAGVGDYGVREQALVPIDHALRDLPPLTVADFYSEDPARRVSALYAIARSGAYESFDLITKCFDDPSTDVRNAAALALNELKPRSGAEFFSRAVETAPPERRRNIADAMIGSGLAAKAISDLGGEDRERAYEALCLLFVMVKISAVGPLIQAIEEHESIRVRSAAIKLLSSSGQMELAAAAARRRLRI